jgi:hypothetical protein
MADSYCIKKTCIGQGIYKNSFARAKVILSIACTGRLTTGLSLYRTLLTLTIIAFLISSVACSNTSLARVHIVKEHDTLKKLALTYLGDSEKWHVLASANPHLSNPNLLSIGSKLIIPNSMHYIKRVQTGSKQGAKREQTENKEGANREHPYTNQGTNREQRGNKKGTNREHPYSNLTIPAQDIRNQHGTYYIQRETANTQVIGNTHISEQLTTIPYK